MRIDYPFQFNGRGRTGQSDEDEYIRELIEQVLLTSPGERVMRPTFGSGIRELLFGAASPEVASGCQYLVQSSLQQWLADLITVEAVEVEPRDSTLLITVKYIVRGSQNRATAQVSVSGGAP